MTKVHGESVLIALQNVVNMFSFKIYHRPRSFIIALIRCQSSGVNTAAIRAIALCNDVVHFQKAWPSSEGFIIVVIIFNIQRQRREARQLSYQSFSISEKILACHWYSSFILVDLHFFITRGRGYIVSV